MAPGGSAQVNLALTAPAAPGDYLLLLDVVSPSSGPLSSLGSQPAIVRVTVGAAPAPAPASSPAPAPHAPGPVTGASPDAGSPAPGAAAPDTTRAARSGRTDHRARARGLSHRHAGARLRPPRGSPVRLTRG